MSELIPPSGTCRISFAASNNLKSINQSVVIIYRLFQIFQRGFPEEDPGEHAGHVESQCPGVAGLRPGTQSQRLQCQQLPGRILPPFPDHNDENGPSPIEPDPPVAGRSVREDSLLVRDPRATMNSRLSSVKWCSQSIDCIDPGRLCADIQNDLEAFESLSAEFTE